MRAGNEEASTTGQNRSVGELVAPDEDQNKGSTHTPTSLPMYQSNELVCQKSISGQGRRDHVAAPLDEEPIEALVVVERRDVSPNRVEILWRTRCTEIAAVPVVVVRQSDALRPREQLLRGFAVDRQLEIVIQLGTREHDAVALVVDDIDCIGAEPVDAVDEAEHLHPADLDLELLLDREHVGGVDDAGLAYVVLD